MTQKKARRGRYIAPTRTIGVRLTAADLAALDAEVSRVASVEPSARVTRASVLRALARGALPAPASP